MDIEVCYADAAGATRIAVTLPTGATVAEAIAASDIVARRSLDPTRLSFAIFGRRVAADAPLHAGDRVELLRPLTVDPMEARRRRVEKRRARISAKDDGPG